FLLRTLEQPGSSSACVLDGKSFLLVGQQRFSLCLPSLATVPASNQPEAGVLKTYASFPICPVDALLDLRSFCVRANQQPFLRTEAGLGYAPNAGCRYEGWDQCHCAVTDRAYAEGQHRQNCWPASSCSCRSSCSCTAKNGNPG